MKKTIILMFSVFLFLGSCSSDNDEVSANPMKNTVWIYNEDKSDFQTEKTITFADSTYAYEGIEIYKAQNDTMRTASIGKYKYLDSIVYFYEKGDTIAAVVTGGNKMFTETEDRLIYRKK